MGKKVEHIRASRLPSPHFPAILLFQQRIMMVIMTGTATKVFGTCKSDRDRIFSLTHYGSGSKPRCRNVVRSGSGKAISQSAIAARRCSSQSTPKNLTKPQRAWARASLNAT